MFKEVASWVIGIAILDLAIYGVLVICGVATAGWLGVGLVKRRVEETTKAESQNDKTI